MTRKRLSETIEPLDLEKIQELADLSSWTMRNSRVSFSAEDFKRRKNDPNIDQIRRYMRIAGRVFESD